MMQGKRIGWLHWGFVLALCSIDFLLSVYATPPIALTWRKAAAMGIVFALWPLLALFTRITGIARGTEEIAHNIALFFLVVMAGSVLEYYLAGFGGALFDDALIAFDAALGFSWPDFYAWATERTALMRVLSLAYYSLELQIALALLAVGAVYPRRAGDFLSATIISVTLTLCVSAFVPVEGPFAHYGHMDLPRADYTEHYALMRSHMLAAIPLSDIRGIISFPSFHVSSALILTYLMRKLSWFSWIIVAVNAVMIVSALVVGGHYLADVLAGIVSGLITIGCLHASAGGEPEPRRLFSRRHGTGALA